MIELGTTAPGTDSDVKDVTDQSFVADVIEASKEAPVVVDFWAPWCGPCKTLGPVLEEEIRATKGAVRMVKVNVDENQMVAAQLRVQSIPAVFAFYEGQPVDGFMGAVTPGEVKKFVQRLVEMAGGEEDGLGSALDAADEMLEQGAARDAAETYAAILGEEPGNGRAIGGMARALIASGALDKAREFLDEAPEEAAKDPHVQAAHAALELAEQTAETGEEAELRARVEADPADHQARFDLALALIARKDHEAAVDELLEIFRRDREWNEGAAKAQLFKLFESLNPKDPVVLKGRRRLSSMIFA